MGRVGAGLADNFNRQGSRFDFPALFFSVLHFDEIHCLL
jgi:hypothetical protein